MARKYRPPPPTYTMVHELMASTTEPLPEFKRRHQLSRMYEGLATIERGAQPSPQDWRMCADAVNLLETMIDEMKIAEDKDGLLPEAIQAMGEAGERHKNGGQIRLSGRGIFVIRAVLEDYAALIDVLPARAVIRAHRLTEARLRAILAGRGRLYPGTKVIDLC